MNVHVIWAWRGSAGTLDAHSHSASPAAARAWLTKRYFPLLHYPCRKRGVHLCSRRPSHLRDRQPSYNHPPTRQPTLHLRPHRVCRCRVSRSHLSVVRAAEFTVFHESIGGRLPGSTSRLRKLHFEVSSPPCGQRTWRIPTINYQAHSVDIDSGKHKGSRRGTLWWSGRFRRRISRLGCLGEESPVRSPPASTASRPSIHRVPQ